MYYMNCPPGSLPGTERGVLDRCIGLRNDGYPNKQFLTEEEEEEERIRKS